MLIGVLLLLGVVFAVLGVKKGFYAMFATLFCLMFAVYIGVLAVPKILRLNEASQQDPYYAAGCVFGLTVLVFVLLWAVAWFYFLRDHDDYFPLALDHIGGGLCGFLFGYILAGILLLLVCMLPISRYKGLPLCCQRDALAKYSVPPVVKACNFISEYSLECFYGDSEKAVEYLLSLDAAAEPQPQPAPATGDRLNRGSL